MTLQMIRASLDARHLGRVAQRQSQRETDLGYAVHGVFQDLFGTDAPKPFAITTDLGMGHVPRGRRVTVLGYTSGKDLARRAQELASPDHHQALDWESFASKPMVTRFEPGRRLGFEVRICPTIRKASAGQHHDKGAEVDAFVSACWDHRGEHVSREAVYGDWLRRKMGVAAEVEEISLTRFVLAPSFRRAGKQRRGGTRRRPDATLRGALRVQDTDALEAVLRRGIGRHRAFGFGMLLLRPT